jgi:hypothetical protein
MIGDRPFQPVHNFDWQAGVGAYLHTKATTHTTFLYDWAVNVGEIKADSTLSQRADGCAGPADTAVHPRITGGSVDLGDAHVHPLKFCGCECFGRADLHTFAAQDAAFLLRQDIGRIHITATVSLMKFDASRGADLAA